jgi:hypothetical protein
MQPQKAFLIRFKRPELTAAPVFAARAEIRGEHVVFLTATNQLTALFRTEMVESWSEIDAR